MRIFKRNTDKNKKKGVFMRIFIGNCFSFSASVFMSLAAYTKSRKGMLVYQTVDCLLLGIAQIIFGVPSGAVVLFLGALRNILMLKNRFGTVALALFCFMAVAVGTLSNTSGILGFIPIIATLVLTIGLFAFKTPRLMKLVILSNLLLWSAYSFMIYDYATGISNGASALICFISLIFKESEKNAEE